MAKVKTDFKDAKNKIRKFKLKAKGRIVRTMEKEIIKSIERGVSPVKGEGRFDGYSQSYLDSIKAGTHSKYSKRKRPVNLKLSGKLLKSFFIKVTSKGIKLGFDNKLADIHNRKGAGKSKAVRRMLPTNSGEEFSRSITTRLKEVLDDVAKTIFKKG